MEKLKKSQTENEAIEIDLDEEMSLAVSDRFATLDIQSDIVGSSKAYCTMKAEDNRARVTLYNACSSPIKLSTMINKKIKLLHVFVEVISIQSDANGVLVNCPRIVLIDENGQGYQAVSVGIYNSIKRMFAIFGDPSTWDKPHTVEVKNVDLAGGQHTFTLEVID